jgi:hypothetical protein
MRVVHCPKRPYCSKTRQLYQKSSENTIAGRFLSFKTAECECENDKLYLNVMQVTPGTVVTSP